MKRFMGMLLAVCLALSGVSAAAAAKEPDIKVEVNGKLQTFDQPPLIKNGRVLVPLRHIFESLQAKVTWDAKTRTVIATKENVATIVLKIGDKTAYVTANVAGVSKEYPVGLDVPAEIRNGRTLVPLRFVADSINGKVDWQAEQRLVQISTAVSASFIKDPAVEQAVRDSLGKQTGPLTIEDMKAVDHLNLMKGTIDLSGLEYASNLKHLFLNANQVTHPEALRSLSALEELSLDYVNVTDLSFLQGMPRLQSLHLSAVPVTDIAPISKLTQLTRLSINQAPISDISPLASLKRLRELALEQNKVADLGPLQGLTQLERLTVYQNPVTTAAPLENLSKLTHLSLTATEIADGQPLAGLTNLQELALNQGKLQNIDFVSNLTHLQLLNAAGNQIAKLPQLSKLTQLQTLLIGENPISDLTPLTGHPALKSLVLDQTDVTDLAPLATLPSLREVTLFQLGIDWNTDAAALQLRQRLEQAGVSVRS
ncbi:leucine-rich repeat domain-containing protein [Brevibacillus fulvus]|uniref:Leucine-rich repeat (LRR) protein n=1 Tax=Brevibacillus fulvus TaxID=1125967 RepID=A0A938Y4G6_9BACL|nr:leucine-rich repeat domain-containing protein [Brevibacillus fulvus]MBM7591786.1 Leucine-rich repeat (LRR) protein [Brevibacillus fulvus]